MGQVLCLEKEIEMTKPRKPDLAKANWKMHNYRTLEKGRIIHLWLGEDWEPHILLETPPQPVGEVRYKLIKVLDNELEDFRFIMGSPSMSGISNKIRNNFSLITHFMGEGRPEDRVTFPGNTKEEEK